MYADTGWYMPHQNHDPLSEEPNHPVPRCQASIIVQCDHVVPNVLLRPSPQPRAGLNGHRSAPNDHTGQSPPVCGTPLAYQPSPPIEYVHPGRPCPQVDYPLVFSSQSSNCSDNGDNVPYLSSDEYPDTQTDAWGSAENTTNYEDDDKHSHSSLNDESTHCHGSDYQHDYPPDPSYVIDHSDLDSSWNSDQDSWLTLDNSQCPPPVSQENHPTEDDPHEVMAEKQPLASQPTESPVVMVKELVRLQQELQSVQDTLVDEHNHFSPVSQIYELEIKAAQLFLAHNQKQFPSTTNSEEKLQTVNGPSCTPTPPYEDELAAG